MKYLLLIYLLFLSVVDKSQIINNCLVRCIYETDKNHPMAKVYSDKKISENIKNWCDLKCKWGV